MSMSIEFGKLARESSKEGDAAKPSKSEAVANPPVDSATGLSQHSMMQLDSIWDSVEEELGCIWEFIGEEPPGSAETRKDEVQISSCSGENKMRVCSCSGCALPLPSCSGENNMRVCSCSGCALPVSSCSGDLVGGRSSLDP